MLSSFGQIGRARKILATPIDEMALQGALLILKPNIADKEDSILGELKLKGFQLIEVL